MLYVNYIVEVVEVDYLEIVGNEFGQVFVEGSLALDGVESQQCLSLLNLFFDEGGLCFVHFVFRESILSKHMAVFQISSSIFPYDFWVSVDVLLGESIISGDVFVIPRILGVAKDEVQGNRASF